MLQFEDVCIIQEYSYEIFESSEKSLFKKLKKLPASPGSSNGNVWLYSFDNHLLKTDISIVSLMLYSSPASLFWIIVCSSYYFVDQFLKLNIHKRCKRNGK